MFVSHNMAAVKELCTKAIVLEYGVIVFEGNTNDAIDFYLKSDIANASAHYLNQSPKDGSDILEVSIIDSSKNVCGVFGFDDQIKLNIKMKVERAIFSSEVTLTNYIKSEGNYSFDVELPFKTLVPNDYRIHVAFHIPNQEIINNLEKILSFNIEETGSDFHKYAGKDYGCVVLDNKWTLKR